MPELPEVETTIKYLRENLLQRSVQQSVLNPGARSIFNYPLAIASQMLEGATFEDIQRQGKFMLFRTDKFLAVGHLRMSGRYFVSSQQLEQPHLHFSWQLDSGNWTHYIDQRRFGTFHFVDNFEKYPGLARLGPDAWQSEINVDELQSKLKRKTQTIYQALMDQSVIAGLGNIYVNEVLFAAGVLPQRIANSVSRAELEKIIVQIKPILAKSLAMKGTTLIDNLYQDPEGKTGEFAKMLQVYGRAGQVCLVCGGLIEKEKIGGRSSFYCRRCQK